MSIRIFVHLCKKLLQYAKYEDKSYFFNSFLKKEGKRKELLKAKNSIEQHTWFWKYEKIRKISKYIFKISFTCPQHERETWRARMEKKKGEEERVRGKERRTSAGH